MKLPGTKWQGMIKCELIVGGYSYRVTDDVMNWDDIVVSVKRGDYDGVVRSFSSKFEFVNGAHALLKKQYRDNYLEAAATVVMSRRNNSWKWNELFRCTLDFSTYEDSGNVISINAVDDSLASLIKAKKGTQYEYSVDAIKEENQLYYDGLSMQNSVEYIIGNNRNDSDQPLIGITTTASKYSGIDLNYSIDEIAISGSVEYNYDGSFEGKRYKTFVRALKNVTVHFSINLKTALDLVDSTDFMSANVCLYKVLSADGSLIGSPLFKGGSLGGNLTPPVENDIDMDIQLGEGEALTLLLESKYSRPYAYGFAKIIKNENAKITFVNRRSNQYIDVVSPTKLLSRLLQSMNGGKEGITGEIQRGHDSRADNCMIVAAESARGIKNAKLYSSFNKFEDWMKATFGYVYDISGNKVTFRHRTKYFTDEVVKKVAEFDDFSHSVNSSLIYSRVRVGYEKQDYDSINGRDEFRFANTFSTGVTLTDNSLDLISPYRADAYGLEFLVQKRGEDTTDTDSDNDVFFVGVELIRRQVVLPGGIATILNQYELIRGGKYAISGVISSETMFNAMYSPRSMLLANKGFIGCCTSRLTYTSGEGNSDVVIGGVKEKDDVPISKEERIITVGELSFSTPEFEIPDNQNGLVLLSKNGEKYVGYIQKASMNTGREECTKFTLAVKRIE